MQISPAESRILKKVIRAWIESEYSDLAKLNYLKLNIDDCTWKFAKRLNSEIGRAVSLDFIFATITETILILYPEYDARERKRQELEDLERKRREAQKVEEQRKQKELEAIRQREEEDERCKRKDVLRGDINRIREIVRDCVCEILEQEPEEVIDDERFWIENYEREIYGSEICCAIEAALETVVGKKIELPTNLPDLTINEIAKVISFYFNHSRYPDVSYVHVYVIEMSKLICQLETDANSLKVTLKMLRGKVGSEFSETLSKSPLANSPKAGSVLVALFMKYAPPWSTSKIQKDKNIENLINATQVLVDNPSYASNYGYDEIKPHKE
jgi:hypothetical protein